MVEHIEPAFYLVWVDDERFLWHRLLADLLATVAQLKLFVTSREMLHVRGITTCLFSYRHLIERRIL